MTGIGFFPHYSELFFQSLGIQVFLETENQNMTNLLTLTELIQGQEKGMYPVLSLL